MMVNLVEGDLIKMALVGFFDVIAHGVNCFNTQGSGIAAQMVKTFKTDTFNLENQGQGSINKLGCVDWEKFYLVSLDGEIIPTKGKLNVIFDQETSVLYVVNLYSQYRFGTDTRKLDYCALRLGLRKLNHLFKGKHIGLPWIGCGLAGGNKEKVLSIIKEELTDCRVTIVEYKV